MNNEEYFQKQAVVTPVCKKKPVVKSQKSTLTARMPQAKASCPKNMLVPKEQNELGQKVTLQKKCYQYHVKVK